MARVLKSGPSRTPCYLRFMNKTGRKVDVIWLDYAGTLRNYGTLDPQRHFDIHTYEGHPWICLDRSSKVTTTVLLNNMEVFYPSAVRDQSHDDRQRRYFVPMDTESSIYEADESKRQNVDLTLPVYSLLELSAEVILNNVNPRRNIRSLNIPKAMQNSLLAQQNERIYFL